MYSTVARTTLLTATRAPRTRPLAVMAILNSPGLRPLSTRPMLGAVSPYEDRPPYESRGTHPPFKPSLDYFTEAIIDFKNFRDLIERFEVARRENDIDLMRAISNTFIYEVSMYSSGKELAVHKALELYGFKELANDSRQKLGQIQSGFVEAGKHRTSPDIEPLAKAMRNSCQILFKYIEVQEKSQHEALVKVLTGPERAELATEYLKARQTAPRRLRPSQTPSQRLIGLMIQPIAEGLSGFVAFADVKFMHSDPTLA